MTTASILQILNESYSISNSSPPSAQRERCRASKAVHAKLARCLTFKIGNRRRLGGWWRQPDPDLGGVTEGKWKSVEGGAHRRWYRPLRTCPTPLSNAANIATRRHPPCCPTTTLAPSCLPFAESTCTHRVLTLRFYALVRNENERKILFFDISIVSFRRIVKQYLRYG